MIVLLEIPWCALPHRPLSLAPSHAVSSKVSPLSWYQAHPSIYRYVGIRENSTHPFVSYRFVFVIPATRPVSVHSKCKCSKLPDFQFQFDPDLPACLLAPSSFLLPPHQRTMNGQPTSFSHFPFLFPWLILATFVYALPSSSPFLPPPSHRPLRFKPHSAPPFRRRCSDPRRGALRMKLNGSPWRCSCGGSSV